MKMNECDFCGSESEHLYPINDGLWAICKVCMDIHYTVLPAIESKKDVQSTQISTRYTIYGHEEE